jgi:hypothetical protein
MAVNVPVEFWDESTWVRYFRDELGAFDSALAGILKARLEVLGRLSGDLAQVLRGGDGELALQILLGGVKQECVDKGVVEHSYFPEGSAARFFREKLGFEVSLDALNKLVNAPKAGNMPQEFAAPSPVSIDKAHYVPHEGFWDDFNKGAVINKLTRLGRMGVVFATHSPADLNDLVIQLTNTKIAMRSEPKVLERVDMAEYAGELAYAQSGVAVAKSFIYRTHAVTFKTLPPQTRHRGV